MLSKVANVMWSPTRRVDMKTALRDWKHKSWELQQWLLQRNLINSNDRFNIMRGVSLWLNYREPTAADFADSDLLRVALNEKRFAREAARNNNSDDSSWQNIFNIMEKQQNRQPQETILVMITAGNRYIVSCRSNRTEL